MNILELDSFNLADAVKFHDRLNPRLWDRGEHLHPKVHAKLMEIARDFQEFLGVPDLDIKDITVSGSNAAYNYTPTSDIDLHLVIDLPEADHSEVYRELFDAKKFQYNAQHNIKIGGYDVELYVQNPNEEHHSQGIYSLLRNAWVSVPRRRKAEIDDISTKSKYQDLTARIDDTIRSGNKDSMASLMKKIKAMRQGGLEQQGEFGADNLAFKMLRNNGYIKRLVDARNAAKDAELSLAELARPKQYVKYGFVGESPDGVDPTTKMFLEEPTDESPDGVNPTTAMFLTETDPETVLNKFIQHTAQRLGIKNMPKIEIHNDQGVWSEENHSFGMYVPEKHELHVSLSNRHLLDILRTTAHELCHCAQHEIEPMPHNAGVTGSPWENEAHAVAGIIMRDFADAHPETFKDEAMDESGGYASYFKVPAPQDKEKSQGRVFNAPQEYYAWKQKQQQKPAPVPDKKPVDESASGYIPKNKKEARDPRYSMAVSVDIKPGQVGREANKLALNTGRNGEPQLLMKSANQLAESLFRELKLFEEQDLFEINMGSKNLRREAAKTGALAGMEFEMIVPNVEGDDGDLEPDYDYDQRCRSIQDAYDFFYDGDYNGRREVDRLRESMQEDYLEWLDEKISEEWESQSEAYITDWIKHNVDESEWNPDDLEGDARNEALEEYSANVHADPVSRAYQDAYDEFRDENQESWDESDWLDAADLDLMSYVENAYSISWPHWTQQNSGEAEISDVAQEFENAIGRDTWASDSYHSSGTLRPSVANQRYVVEPDGSLDPDNSNDRGLEFVSPPLPIDEILSDLNKVKAWAKEYGCYTNDSTGLHINISVPNYSRENLDFVKLALLMGDKYVLDAFGRSSNTYAKSALGIIKDAVRNKPEDAARLLDKMKGNLDQLATKAIHSGITQKYTSINTKDGHIEFRSPGGDWLDENFDQIENTLLRFTVAMSAALNPDMYRQEYLTKLYKLLTQDQKGLDTIKYFSEYVAGKIPKAALRSFVKQAQLERQVNRGQVKGQKMWWEVSNPQYSFASINVVATSREEAIEKALGPDGYPSWANTRQTVVAKPLRPYEESPAKAPGVTLNGRPSNPDGNYVITPENDRGAVAYRFLAANIDDAQIVARQWRQEHPDRVWIVQRDDNRTLGQPAQSGTQGSTNTGQTDMENRLGWPDQTGDANYEIVDRRTGRRVFVMVANTDQDAQRKYTDWLAAAGYPADTENYGYREISSGPGSTLDRQIQRIAQQNSGQFTGEWRVLLPSGEEVYRFYGAGNNQGDANRVAADWLRRNGMGGSGEGFAVLPVMT